jgi:hypothetical protein
MKRGVFLVAFCMLLLVSISVVHAGANSRVGAKSEGDLAGDGQPAPGNRPANVGACLAT